MRPSFQRYISRAKKVPFLRKPIEHIERVIRQRNESQELLRESVESLLAKLNPELANLENLRKFPKIDQEYHRIVQRQSLIAHPNGHGRANTAARKLSGKGIEVGGLHCPVLLPENCEVLYVDLHPYNQLRIGFAYLKNYLMVVPSLTTSGETLASVPQDSLDFIIANHMLEHSENPIQVMLNFADKLKANGVAYLALPDMRGTFDRKRNLTTPGHLFEDFKNGGVNSRQEHLEEYGRKVLGLNGEPLQGFMKNFDFEMGDLHFHVWNPKSFAELLGECSKRLEWPYKSFSIEEFAEEFIVLLHR